MWAAAAFPSPCANDVEKQGFVLLDASSRIICANDDAVRILTYTDRTAAEHLLGDLQEVSRKKQARVPLKDSHHAFEEKVRRPLQTMAMARRPGVDGYSFQIKSGRRTYFCRMFTMTSSARSGRMVGTLFVLQRGAFPAINRIFDRFLLTQREREVAALLLEGLCNKEIAQRMVISVFTVKAFLRSITMKMEVSSRSEIVAKILASSIPPPVPSDAGLEKAVSDQSAPRLGSLSPVALVSALASAKNTGRSQPLYDRPRLQQQEMPRRGGRAN